MPVSFDRTLAKQVNRDLLSDQLTQAIGPCTISLNGFERHDRYRWRPTAGEVVYAVEEGPGGRIEHKAQPGDLLIVGYRESPAPTAAEVDQVLAQHDAVPKGQKELSDEQRDADISTVEAVLRDGTQWRKADIDALARLMLHREGRPV